MKPLFNNQEKNFIEQQGFLAAGFECSVRYGSLQFQPRVVGAVFLIGLVTQSAWVFGTLSALLWIAALLPKLNPFELVYNATFGRRPGAARLPVAPAPRRFAQGMAATFTLFIALFLAVGRPLWAYLLEALMALALTLLILAGFCLGSVVYHALLGRWGFAKKTLPWA